MKSPFDESVRSPVDFVCQHCGDVLVQTAGMVMVCSCTATRDAELTRAAYDRTRPPEMTMREIREKNKRPLRKPVS